MIVERNPTVCYRRTEQKRRRGLGPIQEHNATRRRVRAKLRLAAVKTSGRAMAGSRQIKLHWTRRDVAGLSAAAAAVIRGSAEEVNGLGWDQKDGGEKLVVVGGGEDGVVAVGAVDTGMCKREGEGREEQAGQETQGSLVCDSCDDGAASGRGVAAARKRGGGLWRAAPTPRNRAGGRGGAKTRGRLGCKARRSICGGGGVAFEVTEKGGRRR